MKAQNIKNEDPETKKEIFLRKNFYDLPFPNEYLCKQCRTTLVLTDDKSYHEMQTHVRTLHAQKVELSDHNPGSKIAYFYEKLKNARPPPQYLSKYDSMNLLSDQWFDKLAMQAYPIGIILDSIMSRMSIKAQRQAFFQEAQKISAHLLSCKQDIIKFLGDLPLDLLPGQVLWILRDKYKITPQAAKLMVQKYYYCYQQQNKLLRYLQTRNVTFRKFKSKDYHTIIVFSSATMKQNYLRFGDCVAVSYNFIPLKRDTYGRHHNAIMFTGQDSNLQPVIFAIGVANGQCRTLYKKMIELYLQIMDNLPPQTLLVNNFEIMQEVIKQIKAEKGYNFNIKINWKQMKDVFALQFESTAGINPAMNIFGAALAANSQQQYDMVMDFIRKGNIMDSDKIAQFQKKGYKYCFTKGKPTFVGFCIQQQFAQSIAEEVYKAFPYQNVRGFFYVLALRMQTKLQKSRIDSYSYIRLFQKNRTKIFINSQLLFLEQKLSSQIFKKLLATYEKSILNISVTQKGYTHYILTDTFLNNGQTAPLKIKVHYNLSQNLWICDCKWIYWTGLPCHHLIAVILRNKGSIAYYIHERWFVSYNLTGLPTPEDFQQPEEDQMQEQQQQQTPLVKIDMNTKAFKSQQNGNNQVIIVDSEQELSCQIKIETKKTGKKEEVVYEIQSDS